VCECAAGADFSNMGLKTYLKEGFLHVFRVPFAGI